MATNIYIVKRKTSKKRKNGKATYKLALRWKDPATGKWQCEAAGTADRSEAESLRKLKWAEVNGLLPQAPIALEPEPEPFRPSWLDCRDAVERAMRADNLRPSYVADALLLFDALQKGFPDLGSPADVTLEHANEYKRRRSEGKNAVSPWTLRGDLSTLKAVFGKWLGSECSLLPSNPFEKVKPPKCDDPDVRIVTAGETAELFAWLNERWNNWRLPLVYLEVAALLGWRATEIASLRDEDLLADGYVRVCAGSSKTRKYKYGWLPEDLHAELCACSAGGWAFGRFSDELRRLLILWKRQPNHAARVKGFGPCRLVGWVQQELQRFNDAKTAKAVEGKRQWEPFTMHDFRRTAITGMQMAGASEKDVSVMVGATPEVIRRHYDRMDQLTIARRNVERRIGTGGKGATQMHRSLRARCAQPETGSLDESRNSTQTVSA
ncbi:MAG TPA: hypothetical protein VGN12_27355 [Pirellulales bacterium]|jgi:integrase